MTRLIYGIGINDADYEVTLHDKTAKRKIIWRCPVHLTWSLLLMRCFSEPYREKYPTYKECTIHKAWLKFSNFAKWMKKQDYEGKCLDKDILIPGNKHYSPKTCVFIDNLVNTFVTDNAASRGDWPIGVSKQNCVTNPFKASCRNQLTKEREYLGSFDDPNLAHLAWKKRKHELACQLAKQQSDPRVAKALRNRYKGK